MSSSSKSVLPAKRLYSSQSSVALVTTNRTITAKKAESDAIPEDIIAGFSAAVCGGDENNLEQLQRYAVERVIDEHENVFITGQAGTGKSFVIGEILRRAAALGIDIALTATTGLAAANLEPIAPPRVTPQTIHRWAGIGLGQESVGELAAKISKNKYTLRRWQSKRLLLVIDEISMMSPTLLRKLDQIARLLRQSPKIPFGGIQVLFVGDFYQLPPVIKSGSSDEQHDCGRDGLPYEYCFETPTWTDALDEEILLQRIFRQSDERFIDVLREVRDGRLSQKSIALLKQRSYESLFYELVALQKQVLQRLKKTGEKDKEEDTGREDGEEESSSSNPSVETGKLRALLAEAGMEIPTHLRVLLGSVEPTKLMTVNRIVDEENSRRMAELKGASMMYEAFFDHNSKSEQQIEMIAKEMKQSVTAPEFLELKVGAQVLLLANLDDTLVNGRRGYVVDFVSDAQIAAAEDGGGGDGTEEEDKDGDEEKDDGYARAIAKHHRPGERIVGLSKQAATTAAGERKKKKKRGNEPEKEAISAVGLSTAVKNGGVPLWPLVEFDNGCKQAIKPYKWERKNAEFKWKASITQIPLKPAYAMSIHKSQSQTLSSVAIDLTSVFAAGMAYSAVSRATSLEGLVLENFDESFFTAQPPNWKVVHYYRQLVAEQEKKEKGNGGAVSTSSASTKKMK